MKAEPIYAGEFYEESLRRMDSYRIIANYLVREFEFESVLDVGCGNGMLLAAIKAEFGSRRSLDLCGVDSSVNGIEGFIDKTIPAACLDFARGPLNGIKKADLVVSMEVAEHISSEHEDSFIDRIVQHCRSTCFFTAVVPGQPGHWHVNCRENIHWMEKFRRRGWIFDAYRTHHFRLAISHCGDIGYLLHSSMFFKPALSVEFVTNHRLIKA